VSQYSNEELGNTVVTMEFIMVTVETLQYYRGDGLQGWGLENWNGDGDEIMGRGGEGENSRDMMGRGKLWG